MAISQAALPRMANGKRGKCEIYPYFDEHGIDKFKLIPIKSYDIVDKKALTAMEQLWINKLRCVNKNNPFQLKRLYKKQWYEENKKRILEKRQANKARDTTKYNCDCGGRYTYRGRASHFKTHKHKSWLETH